MSQYQEPGTFVTAHAQTKGCCSLIIWTSATLNIGVNPSFSFEISIFKALISMVR